jgi:hypothetical protein
MSDMRRFRRVLTAPGRKNSFQISRLVIFPHEGAAYSSLLTKYPLPGVFAT